MNILLLTVGAAVLADGILVLVRSNFSLGILMTLFLGAALLLWGAFYGVLAATAAGSIFNTVIQALLLVYFAFVCILIGLGRRNNIGYDEDAAIVLGCGIHGDEISYSLRNRLDSAVEYHAQNPEAYIVVSGGQGPQETITEAEAMERYLLSRGVAPEKILREEKSTSTEENLRFSKRVLEEKLGAVRSVVVITNDYHICRSVKVAGKEGYERVTHKYAATPLASVLPGVLRESVAVLMFWIKNM